MSIKADIINLNSLIGSQRYYFLDSFPNTLNRIGTKAKLIKQSLGHLLYFTHIYYYFCPLNSKV